MKKKATKTGYHCKGNVMTPLNWFGIAFETVLIPTAATQHDNWVGVACIILAAIVLLAYLVIYIGFALNDPNRLQSEEFNLYQKELSVELGPIAIVSQPQEITKAIADNSDNKS